MQSPQFRVARTPRRRRPVGSSQRRNAGVSRPERFRGGTMGEQSVILEGVESELGAQSLYSAIHGAPAARPSRRNYQGRHPAKLGLSVTAAAKALGVSGQMLHDILAERKPLSAVMCLKASRLFGGSPEIWMRMQAAYDLKKAEQDKKIMESVARIAPVKPSDEVRA
jgi:antitoxin HigA-1